MKQFSITSSDGVTPLACYATECESPKAMVQISHGMCEFFGRYEGFAEYLTEAGFLVFGHDHLGHGNTAPDADSLGFTVPGGGWENLVEDVHNLSLRMKQQYPNVPLILFGHSMGSFIAREALARYGSAYRAAVICGTGGPETPAGLGKLLANFIMAFHGEHYRSRMLKRIAFMGYNKKYEKGCSKLAWLTRDEEIVRAYKAEPKCMFTFTVRAYHDLFSLVSVVSRKDWAERLPKDLPILLMSGDMDPVGSWGKGVRSVAKRLEKAGIEDLTLRLYEGMRHEVLNEIGREQVWEETKQWLEQFKQSQN